MVATHGTEDMTAAEVLVKMEEEGKKYCAGTKNSLVWCTFAGRIFQLHCNFNLVVAKKHALLEEESVRLQYNNA